MSNVVSITDAEFDSVIQSDTPVLVDFWAEWCGPCKAIAPTLDALSTEFDGKVKIVKLNVDENQETAAKFGIRSIPTLKLFKNGEEIDMVVGGLPKQEFVDFLNKHI